jgi:hypothetical protein
MADVFSNLIGTMKSYFGIGGPGGIRINNNSGVAEAKNSAGTGYINITAANAAIDANLVTRTDVKNMALVAIGFCFDGASPPSPGANTGLYGMCGKTGGSYTAGDIVYDPGSVALLAITVFVNQLITTNIAVTGAGYTVTLFTNFLYVATSTGPNVWAARGDTGGNDTGYTKEILVSVGTSATTDSTKTIPNTAYVNDVILLVSTPYTASATIAVHVQGSSPVLVMDTTDNDPQVAGTYANNNLVTGVSTNGGVVRVTIANSPIAGVSKVLVRYSVPDV